jgi:hypothetical protein
MADALKGVTDGMDVPCNGCTACCRTDSAITVEPGEPAAQFAEEREGKLALYPVDGHCPQFVDGACAIYPDRPRICRAYDCRMHLFCAVAPSGPILEVVRERWIPILATSFKAPGDKKTHQHMSVVAQMVYQEIPDVSAAVTAAVATARMAQQEGLDPTDERVLHRAASVALDAAGKAIN